MNRSQFEHALRAAAAVVGVREVKADIVIPDDRREEKADLIDGSIGEASVFHETFGYYAQGVSIETAILPKGWKDRLVRFESPATEGVVAWCLSLEDLWVSKALAGRPKDLEFCRDLIGLSVLDRPALREYIESAEAHEEKKAVALGLLGEATD